MKITNGTISTVTPQGLIVAGGGTQYAVFFTPQSKINVAGTAAPEVLELWDWHLGPGDDYRGEAHSPGTRELLSVLKGTVRLTVAGESWDLRVGDAASFIGDVPHGYANPGTSPARFALTVFEPPRTGAER